MVPGLDEKVSKRVPPQLLYPIKEIDIIRMKIKVFFSLRYMVAHLLQNDGSTNLRLKENPMKRDDREVAKWQVGQAYEVSQLT